MPPMPSTPGPVGAPLEVFVALDVLVAVGTGGSPVASGTGVLVVAEVVGSPGGV